MTRMLFSSLALGVVIFFIGLSFILNGLFLTVPKQSASNRMEVSEDERDQLSAPARGLETPTTIPSVTEPTTRHLDIKA
ncbi:MAG: hypothetical protein ABR530_10825 [Pyrinomonadaceae bacterium]